jgi:hypothetical protein
MTAWKTVRSGAWHIFQTSFWCPAELPCTLLCWISLAFLLLFDNLTRCLSNVSVVALTWAYTLSSLLRLEICIGQTSWSRRIESPLFSFLFPGNANFEITKLIKAATCQIKPFDKTLQTKRCYCPDIAPSKWRPTPLYLEVHHEPT